MAPITTTPTTPTTPITPTTPRHSDPSPPVIARHSRALTRADMSINPVQAAVMRHVLYMIANAEFDPNEVTPLEFGVGLQEMALAVLLATTPRENTQ